MDGSSHIVCPHCDAINRVPRERLPNHDAVGGRCGNCHEALFDRHPVTLDTARFERHLEKSDVPLLIDFWRNGAARAASWRRNSNARRR